MWLMKFNLIVIILLQLQKYNRFAERNLGATHAEVGHYCGDTLPPLVSTGGNMDTLEVNFKSDMSVAHKNDNKRSISRNAQELKN